MRNRHLQWYLAGGGHQADFEPRVWQVYHLGQGKTGLLGSRCRDADGQHGGHRNDMAGRDKKGHTPMARDLHGESVQGVLVPEGLVEDAV